MLEQRYEPTESQRTRKELRRARGRLARAEADEVAAGFEATDDLAFDARLRMAIGLLVGGMDARDWRQVADGVAVLQAAEMDLRNAIAGEQARAN